MRLSDFTCDEWHNTISFDICHQTSQASMKIAEYIHVFVTPRPGVYSGGVHVYRLAGLQDINAIIKDDFVLLREAVVVFTSRTPLVVVTGVVRWTYFLVQHNDPVKQILLFAMFGFKVSGPINHFSCPGRFKASV